MIDNGLVSSENEPTTTDRDKTLKLPLLGNVPQELIAQLVVMRRNPDHFWLRGRSSCSLGCDAKGMRSGYQLGHADADEAGTWCPKHGWLSFPSDALPPTEHLTAAEIEDNRRAGQRRQEFAQRKAARS